MAAEIIEATEEAAATAVEKEEAAEAAEKEGATEALEAEAIAIEATAALEEATEA